MVRKSWDYVWAASELGFAYVWENFTGTLIDRATQFVEFLHYVFIEGWDCYHALLQNQPTVMLGIIF